MNRHIKRCGIAVLALLNIHAAARAATDDIWFGTSQDNPAPITQLLTTPGDALNVYLYASSTDRLLGASLALTWGNGFEVEAWTPNPGFVSHIGGPTAIALNGQMKLADDVTDGYVYETGPIDNPAWNGLVGVLTLKHTLTLGQMDIISIWTDGSSWSRASAIYDMDTFGVWVGRDLTVQAVPEPTAMIPLATGLMGLWSLRCKRLRDN